MALGWEFRSAEGIICPKVSKFWKLSLALEYAVHMHRISGKQAMRLVGHFVAMSLIRREAPCCLSAVYAYMSKYEFVSHVPWPSVRRELEWIRSLLPLMIHEVRSEVPSRVLCTDASHWGKGAVHGWLAPSQVESRLRERGRWRFRADPEAI